MPTLSSVLTIHGLNNTARIFRTQFGWCYCYLKVTVTHICHYISLQITAAAPGLKTGSGK